MSTLPNTKNFRPEHFVPSRIVIRGTNWVGDTVMSIPAIKELRRIFPDSLINFWAPAGLVSLVAATGLVDGVIPFDGNTSGLLQRPFIMSKKLSGNRFELAVHFQNAFESAFTSWLAGIPRRAGYPTDLRGPLLNIKIPFPKNIKQKHQVFYYLGITDFLEEYFWNRNTRNLDPDCSVPIDEKSFCKAQELIYSTDARFKNLFCLCPGSVNSEAKRWPADYFAELADLLRENHDAKIVFVGSSSESNMINDIIAKMAKPEALNLAGKTDLITSMAIMKLSRLVISNDTGSAHLAVAASAPVLTIFGPTVPGATAPYGPNAYVLQGKASCAPCRHFRCPLRDHPCMRSILPEHLMEKLDEILIVQ